MEYIALALVSVLAGGYGGYKWGRYVEAKAKAALEALKG